MEEDRRRMEALRKRLEPERKEAKTTKKSSVDLAKREKLTVYLTPEIKEKMEDVYAEVYYRTRARKINFIEEVMKAGLEDPEKIVRLLKEKED